MSDPNSATDYPTFAGTTGKRDILRAFWENRFNPGAIQGLLFRLSSTDLDACTDKSTLYDASDTFESAR